MTELAKCSEDLQRLVMAVIFLLVFFKDLKKFQLCRCGCLCLYLWAQIPGEGVESLRARGSGCRELTNVGSGKLPWILQRAATLLTTEPSLRYQHSVFKWNMLQNLRYKMGEMSHDLVKEMVSPNPWNPKLFLNSSRSAPRELGRNWCFK